MSARLRLFAACWGGGLLLGAATAFAATCDQIFPEAVQSHSGGSISIGRDACEEPACTVHSGTSATTGLVFQSGSGSDGAITVPKRGITSVGSAGDNDFTTVSVGEEGTLSFSSLQTEYFFSGNFSTNKEAVLQLAPGDYWISGNLSLGQEVRLSVTPATGTVRIHVQGDVTIGRDAVLNGAGGAGDLLIYAAGNIDVDRDVDISGFLYAEGDVTLGRDVQVDGGVAGDDISLGRDTEVAVQAGELSNGDFGDFCQGSGAGGADHYAISHDGVGISCQVEQITITAHDASDVAVDPGAVNLALSTSTGRGKWASVVAGTGTLSNNGAFDGNATYSFPGNGETSVTLAFNYPELLTDPELVNVDLSDGSATDSGTGAAPEDASLSVALSGFLFNSVPTQIAAKASDLGWNAALLQVHAVRASDNDPSVCAALFSGAVTIEVGAECRNPTSCSQSVRLDADDGSLATPVNPATTIATNADNSAPLTSAYTPVTLNFDASARAYYAIDYADAGQLQLHARYELEDENGIASGQYMSGSSNDFVVRPFALGFTNIDDGGAPAVVNPGGVAPAGTGFLTAATPFQFDLGGYRYADGEDLDSDGLADAVADVTDNGVTANFSASATLALGAITPAGGTNGVLSAAAVSIANGTAVDHSASYNEVGSLTITASVTDYLGAADADVVGTSPVIGRFYPASLVLLTGNSVQGSCNNFSYMDASSLSVDYSVEARNQDGVRTQHYDQLLMGGSGSLAWFTSHAENASDGVDRGGRLSGLVGSWSAGRYAVSTSSASFARDSSPDGPFDDLQLRISTTNPLPESLPLSGAVGSPPAVEIGVPVLVRYGRLAAENAFGPETEALPQPLQTEYFNGSGFVIHDRDDCTEIDFSLVQMNALSLNPMPPNIPLDSGTGTTVPSFGLPSGTGFRLSGGDAGLVYSAPGAGNTGAVTLAIDLTTVGWLQFDWDGNGSADTAMRSAAATFGHYRGNDRVLFWEENVTR